MLGLGVAAGDGSPPSPPVAKSVPELLDLFGVANAPVDFVVVIDTSGSMQEGADPTYPKVVAAYQQFVAAARPNDYLSVLTFDTAPNLVFAGQLDEPGAKERATGALPQQARGQHTDIGAGLDGALGRLDRPNANEVEIVLFLTDGVHEPGRGSAFPDTSGSSWDELKTRGVALESGHRVFAYGAGLENGQPTDIGLVRGVFSRTQIESLPPDQLGRLFQEAVDRGRVELLRRPVTEEVQKAATTVQVVPVGDLADPARFAGTFTCGAKTLPCEFDVKGVSVFDTDGKPVKANLVDGRQTLLVAPGATSSPVSVVAQPELTDPGIRQIGTQPQTQSYTVAFDVDTSLQPKELINRTVGIDTSITTSQQKDPVALSRQVGVPVQRFVLFLALLALLLLALGYLFRRLFTLPPLRGAIQLPDRTLIRLAGTTQRFPDRKHQAAETSGAVAEFFTKRRKWGKVYVRPKTQTIEVQQGHNYRPVTGDELIRPATRLKIGDLPVLYTPKRRATNVAAPTGGSKPIGADEGADIY